jgi:hypothetical protein
LNKLENEINEMKIPILIGILYMSGLCEYQENMQICKRRIGEVLWQKR